MKNKFQTFQINDISSVSSFLESGQSAEGIFGFEYQYRKGRGQLYFLTESLSFSLEKPVPVVHVYPEDASFFHIVPNYPCFFPFNMEGVSFWDSFAIPDNSEIMLQLIFRKRKDDWKDLFLRQYNTYLSGVDIPAHNKWLRKLQCAIADTLTEKVGWAMQNVPIPQAEQKRAEEGFQFAIRLVAAGTEKKKAIASVKKKMQEYHYTNEWSIVPASSVLLRFIQERHFCLKNSKYHILCTSEIKPLFQTNKTEDIPSTGQLIEALPKAAGNELLSLNVAPILATSPSIPSSAPTTTLANPFDFLPGNDEKQQDTENQKIVEKLSAAFKKLNMIKAQKLEITRIQDGPTMQKVTFRLKGLTFSDLEKQVKNLKAELGVDSLAVENGEEAGTAALLFKHDTPKPVFLRDLLNSQEFQAFKNTVDLPVVIGVDTIGNPILDSLERLRHLLVAGTTGSGKSMYINVFLLTLLLLKKPSEIAVFCIDPKRVELAHFRQFPQVKEVITDMDKANDLLKKIVSEMERRYELMEKAGVKTMQAYNEISSHKLHYIIVVIDEYADLVMEHPDVEMAVRRLGQMARAAGIHLVIATQRPDSEILTSKIKTNIRSRICFACASRHDYGTVLDRAVNFDLAGRGDGLCTREGVSGLTRFQGAMIAQSEKGEKEIFVAAAMKWVNQEQTINPELEKLKQIVAETKEVRIKELQKRMGMRTAKVQELMVLLVEEGWLEAPQEEYQSYRILLSDEELQKYIQGQSS